jgi:hypothetical protein
MNLSRCAMVAALALVGLHAAGPAPVPNPGPGPGSVTIVPDRPCTCPPSTTAAA